MNESIHLARTEIRADIAHHISWMKDQGQDTLAEVLSLTEELVELARSIAST